MVSAGVGARISPVGGEGRSAQRPETHWGYRRNCAQVGVAGFSCGRRASYGWDI